MKIFSKKSFVLFAISALSPILLLSQTFEKSILVNIPGDNYDLDLLSTDPHYGAEAFITWVNKIDSTYTVYLKRISPEISDSNIVVASDDGIKSNPKIAFNRYAQGIKIVWQIYSNNYYKIISTNYSNDSLSSPFVIQDSLTNDPQITLSTHRLAWIYNDSLFINEFYPSLGDPILVDSSICASPNILKDDAIQFTQILYERIENVNHQIYFAEFKDFPNPKWTYELISDGDNRNPNFGIMGGVSFEKIENDISRIMYSSYGTYMLEITENTNCNFKNPNVFSYPVTTSPDDEQTNFFAAFDTDSLTNNNEVFIKPFYFGLSYDLINISNSEGNDYNPRAGYITIDETIYAAIFWLHDDNSKTDIWMAKTVFDPIINTVNDGDLNLSSFKLQQNYPNPFNPTTKISFTVPLFTHPSIPSREGKERRDRGVLVTLKVYDILGNEIATLVNEPKAPGTYKVEFNGHSYEGQNLTSGVYFYKLSVGQFSETKKMVLLR
ncbi:MAG: hypothetical protein HND52_18710 [Ignavibacteriae bacterium]|nr:hypothetical protein [Ignavibacteriota bacterium]NOG99996.1 hypothetical protein [Ignavibacteriota bacterium]